MDQKQVYPTEFAISGETEELLLDSEMTEWRPFTTANKIHMQKHFLDSLVPQSTSTKLYRQDDENVCFPDERNQISRFQTFSEYQTAERPENIIVNTDFLSAIPYARQSKTVKRKLNYEENSLWNANDTAQKPKTYFPFEFIGHASRQSASQLNPYPTSNKENESLINPTKVSGCVLRKSESDGRMFETLFTTQNEQPLPQRKRSKKHSRNKTNSVVAVEQHFEQIRRKHAEFNWDIPDSQNTMKNEGHSQTDVDIQRVPTTPYIEHYSSSPSMYSLNDTPVQGTTIPWTTAPRPSFERQYREQGGSQRFATNIYGYGGSSWSSNNGLHDASKDKRNHLYPY